MAPEGEVGRLRLRPLVRDVLAGYRGHWRMLVPLALIVLLPQALADALVGDLEVHGVEEIGDIVKLAAIPLTVGINLGGEALFAGIIAAAVLEWRAGRRLLDVPGAARHIPYGRLIILDLIVAAGTAAGVILLIVPGLVFYTYFVIAPAMAELQGRGVRDALRGAVRMVRGNFWRVLAFTLFLVVISDSAAALIESPFEGVAYEAGLHLAIKAALEPIQGLGTVLMALALMDLHGERPRSARPA